MKAPVLEDRGFAYNLLLAAIVLAGIAARSIEIDYSLDGDEIFSVSLATEDFGAVIQASLQDKPHPPLYNVLLHVWTGLFGHGEISVRLLSVAFSAGFLLVGERILARFVSPPFRLVALALLALSPFFIYYGQQARPYALIALLAAANLLAFLRLTEMPGLRRVAIWAATCALLVYSQYIAVLLVAVEIAFAMFVLPKRRLLVAGSGVAASALIAPWAMAAMGAALSSGADPLGQIAWMGKPGPVDLVWFYVSLFGEAPFVPARVLFLLLVIPAGAYAWRAWKERKVPAAHALLMALAIGLPLLTFVISVAGPKPVFAPRQLELAGFAFIALVAIGLERLPASAGAAIGAALLAWTAASIGEAFPHNQKPPWREAAREIARSGVTLIVEEREFHRSLGYYAPRADIRLWDDFPDDAKIRRFAFLCRPFKCAALKEFQARAALVKVWHWNTAKGATGYNQLKLFEVSPIGAAATPEQP